MTTHNEFVHTAINLFIEILSSINELENIFFCLFEYTEMYRGFFAMIYRTKYV